MIVAGHKSIEEYGFVEIDYDKPLSNQISQGDLVITTEMSAYLEESETGICFPTDLFLKHDEQRLVVSKVTDRYFINEDELFDTGRMFVKKQELKFVSVLVPEFLVDQVLRMGAKLP